MKYQTTNILRLTNIARKNIQREKLFHSWHNLLITLSGGQDSAFCLLVLYLLKDKNKKKIPFYTYTSLFKTLNAYTYQSKERLRRLQKRSGEYKNFGPVACTNETGLCKNEVMQKRMLLHNFVFAKAGLCANGGAFCSLHKQSLCVQNEVLQPRLCIERQNNLVWHEKNQITEFYLTFSLVTNYTLLWCNHFWQKDAFFTMEHVSKLAFSKKYTIHLFAPVQKVISEQEARYWRHKIMQRSSFFTCQPKFCYKLQQNSNKKRLKQYISAGFVQAKPAFANKKTTNFAQTLACKNRVFATLVVQTKWGNAQAKLVQSACKSERFCITEFLQRRGFRHFTKAKLLHAKLCSRVARAKLVRVKTELCKSVRFCKRCRSERSCVQNFVLQPPVLQSAQPERTTFFRTQTLPKSQSGQFLTLFLDFVLLARPLLLTLTDNQSSTLVKNSRQNHISSTTFGLSELLCVQGHNKSDRAEAILFNLIRGAGINGISTLQWKQSLSKLVLENEPARTHTKAPFLQPSFPFLRGPAFVTGATLCTQSAKALPLQAAKSKPWYSSKKAKFYCANELFYPILSDFLKEIAIIHLDVFIFKEDNLKKKNDKQNNFSRLAILQKISFQQDYSYSRIQRNGYNIQTNLHKIKLTNFDQQKKVNTKMFYYQLKYKQNKFYCC